MSNSTLMSIKDMIDATFGSEEVNTVNFKLMQTILYILARQLRILERRVEIEVIRGLKITSSTSLTISEIKIQARKVTAGQYATSDKKGSNKADRSRKSTASKTPTSTDKTPTSTDKTTTSSSKTPTSSVKTATFTDVTPTSTDKTPTSTDKTLTSSGKTTTSTDKTQTSTDRTQTSTDKTQTSTDKTQTSADKTQTSTDKTQTSTDKTQTSTDKTQTSTEKTQTSSAKTATEISTDVTKKETKSMVLYLEALEQKREKELRVIHQRADSREEGTLTPSPMASISEAEMEYEKLLIVDRVPADRTSGSALELYERMPRLSVVTKEEFLQLQGLVQQIHQKFATVGQPEFPDNAKLMEDLRRGASLTDAMAALQLSARLEAAEKSLTQMSEIVTNLVQKLPKDKPTPSKTETQVLFESPTEQGKSRKSVRKTILAEETGRKSSLTLSDPRKETITHEELQAAMKNLNDEFVKTVTATTKRSAAYAENALKIVKQIEGQLDRTEALEKQMIELEFVVANYTDQINTLDTGLTSQMSNYQEELTQMQHDLEIGLESMAEALANTGGDTAAVAELNNHFSMLQMDIDNSNLNQRELHEKQNALSLDFKALWKQIEILRETKADRDEVADGLRDKAGIGALNGLVSIQQFDAVRFDIEKKIKYAYDKFNNQESVWQKAIEDLFREINEKAELIQVESLRVDVNANLEKLRRKLKWMLDVVGEPKAAALSRQIHRDANCLSCATAAHMDLENEGIPILPGFYTSHNTGSTYAPKEDGDHGVCYQGRPVCHPKDPRSHFCQRYCGGSHTKIGGNISRVPPSMILSQMKTPYTTGIGTDGKTYMLDPDYATKPCLPCNIPPSKAPESSITDVDSKEPDLPVVSVDFGSDMTPEDFITPTGLDQQNSTMMSNTPPPYVD